VQQRSTDPRLFFRRFLIFTHNHLLAMPPMQADSTSVLQSNIRVIKERLREALPHLREKYAVERLFLHGSRVRGEADAGSDLDILVDFQDTEAGRQVSLLDFIALKQELEASLDMPVDLGERTALQGAVGDKIWEEAEPV